MKVSKYIHLAVALLFIYFSFVQLNDLDAWKWILIYSSIALLAFLRFADIKTRLFARLLFIALAIYALMNFNLLASWIKAGRPAFLDYAEKDIQIAENMREFLGLCVALLTALAYALGSSKK